MNSINSVDVLSIDEEKLKFRVIVSFVAQNLAENKGVYKFLLPNPTALTNSNRYDQCVIQCNGFHAYTNNIPDPTWTDTAALAKVGCIQLELDIPSAQTVATNCNAAGVSGVGVSSISGYRELLFLDCHSIGDAAANVALGATTAAWIGSSKSEPIMCGNPFGKTVTIRNIDLVANAPVWLVANAAGGGANGNDLGIYMYSFDITMIENK